MANPAKTSGERQSEATQRLRRTLSRIAMGREAVQEEAHTTATNCESLFRLVISEIEETILPRKLAVLSSNGVEAAMVLANRRLLELGSNDATMQPVGNSEGQMSSLTYAQVLRRIDERTQAVTLKRVSRAAAFTTRGASCSAAQLAESGKSLHRGNRMLAFFQVIRPYTKACILDQGAGRGVRRGGQAASLQLLDALDQFGTTRSAERNGNDKLGHAEPSCTALAISDQLQAIIVTDGPERMSAAIGLDDKIAVMKAWQKIFC